MEKIEGHSHKFILRHKGRDRRNDITVTGLINEEEKTISWENMPVAIDMNLCLLKFTFFMLKHHAYSCILLAIEKTKDDLS